MYLKEEISNVSIWSAIAWEKRDVRSDNLPLMNSFIWPLGKLRGNGPNTLSKSSGMIFSYGTHRFGNEF